MQKLKNYSKSIVPTAIDANTLYRMNNPGFDFEYKGLTIDVKYSSLRNNSKAPKRQWGIKCKGDRDFIVAFLEREPNSELDEPIILIIPYGMLSFFAISLLLCSIKLYQPLFF